jgi:hypothetical protein
MKIRSFIPRFRQKLLTTSRNILDNSWLNPVFLIFSFTFGLGFFNLHSVIFALGSSFFLLILFLAKRIKFTRHMLISFLFGFTFFIFYTINFGFVFKSLIYYCFLLPLSFWFGNNFFSNFKHDEKLTFTYQFLFFLLLGFAVRWSLNIILTGYFYGFLSPSRRYIDIWYPTIRPLNATGLMNFSVFIIPFLVNIFLTLIKKKNKFSILIFITILLFIILELSVGNRSFIILIALIPTFYLLKYLDFLAETSPKKYFAVGFSILFGVLFIYISINKNFFGIKTLIDKVPVLYRLINIFEDESSIARFNLLKEFFSKFYLYPFGGYFTTYIHNNFLDIYAYAGVVPTILFFYLFFASIKKQKRISNQSGIHHPLFPLISLLILGIFVLYLFEPAIVSSIQIMTIHFFLMGLVFQNTYSRYHFGPSFYPSKEIHDVRSGTCDNIQKTELTLDILIGAYAESYTKVEMILNNTIPSLNYLIRIQGLNIENYSGINIPANIEIANDIGVSKNRNHLLLKSQADIVVFLDDDCLISETFSQTIIEYFINNPQNYAVRFKVNTDTKRMRVIDPDKEVLSYYDNSDVGVLAFAFNRKFLLEKKIFFNEKIGPGTKYIQASEDTLFIKTFFKEGGTCGYIDGIVVDILNLGESTWKTEYNERRIITIGGAYYMLYKGLWPIMLFRYWFIHRRKIPVTFKDFFKYFYKGVCFGRNIRRETKNETKKRKK